MARQEVETHSATSGEFGDVSEDLGHETRNTGIPPELGIDALNGARARLQARASHAVEVSSEYVRTHDVEDMRSDLEHEIRTHPIRSIALALGAGYVLGKLFR